MGVNSPAFLYIEDDPLSRDVLSIFLTEVMGYSQLVVWEDSSAFEEKFKRLSPKPDVIFVDIHMQPITGFEVLRIIRQYEDFQDKPVIALTASVMSEEVKMLKEAGFNGAIGKPINVDTFPEALSHILNGEAVWRVQ